MATAPDCLSEDCEFESRYHCKFKIVLQHIGAWRFPVTEKIAGSNPVSTANLITSCCVTANIPDCLSGAQASIPARILNNKMYSF